MKEERWYFLGFPKGILELAKLKFIGFLCQFITIFNFRFFFLNFSVYLAGSKFYSFTNFFMKKSISLILLSAILVSNTIISGQSVYAVGATAGSNNKYVRQAKTAVDQYVEKQEFALVDDSVIINNLTVIRGKLEKIKQQRQQVNKYTGSTVTLVESLFIVIDAKVKELSDNTNTTGTNNDLLSNLF